MKKFFQSEKFAQLMAITANAAFICVMAMLVTTVAAFAALFLGSAVITAKVIFATGLSLSVIASLIYGLRRYRAQKK